MARNLPHRLCSHDLQFRNRRVDTGTPPTTCTLSYGRHRLKVIPCPKYRKSSKLDISAVQVDATSIFNRHRYFGSRSPYARLVVVVFVAIYHISLLSSTLVALTPCLLLLTSIKYEVYLLYAIYLLAQNVALVYFVCLLFSWWRRIPCSMRDCI
ncbi:hypothetical protein IW261DRAFT_683848 [Armillaria novae-zelandiae]|uniref:Uncharacterized protein n=1 Tax=Armillaria novae-zelandiae TaxID=153914 RepID=A0AA39U8T6_9AGAR|nr:hypothetical protein IW261DRAFT_683848 [Armillaria novae-zelandiae]